MIYHVGQGLYQHLALINSTPGYRPAQGSENKRREFSPDNGVPDRRQGRFTGHNSESNGTTGVGDNKHLRSAACGSKARMPII